MPGQLKTEVDTLAKLLKPAGDGGLPPILDQIAVAPGYEMALAAALGEDLEVPVVTHALVPPPVHWRLNAAQATRRGAASWHRAVACPRLPAPPS